MNLKENYERFFGGMAPLNKLGQKIKPKQEENAIKLTPNQINHWRRLNSGFTSHYPKHSLQIKNGNITIDNNHIVESVQSFFKRNESAMIQTLKAAVQKLKD